MNSKYDNTSCSSGLIQSTAYQPNLFIAKGAVKVTSLTVASDFGKRHDNVLQAIKNLPIPEEFRLLNFQETSYLDSQSKEQPLVEMTRDGFTLLTMGFSGEKAVRWKIAYIHAFNLMEAKLNYQGALIRELLLSNRKWRKILRYRQLKLSQREIGKLLDRFIYVNKS
ncbi:MAG: hypothetical protein BWK78_08725 [Thiotrichaceae bacterium IS1]|nr:MAG: hypothetical protein BWK78_08725 [Thiotrichaceae bacterium IS1]